VAAHYFSKFLYRRDVGNVRNYLSHREANRVQDLVNDHRLADILANKLTFIEHFSRGGFPVPRLLGYNNAERLYLNMGEKWTATDITRRADFAGALEALMARWEIEQVFVKKIHGSGGKDAFKVTRADLKAGSEGTHSAIARDYYVIQEVVEQHPSLAVLNPDTLNTMRIDTFKEPGKPPEILSGFLRVGGAGNYVDNVSQGGVWVGIHLHDGTLKEFANKRFYGGTGVKTFRNNPINGLAFGGFQIPMFENVKRTVLEAADYIPTALLGWDVAVSPAGPILIEANILYYELSGVDIAYGGYRSHPVWQRAAAYARARRRAH
jgi:hypothetical protein